MSQLVILSTLKSIARYSPVSRRYSIPVLFVTLNTMNKVKLTLTHFLIGWPTTALPKLENDDLRTSFFSSDNAELYY